MPEPGKSFELWLISDKLPQPRSLGVIGGSDFTARPVLAVLRRRHDQRRDLCGDGRAGRRLARRQAALDAGLYRQADRDGAGGALSLPSPQGEEVASALDHKVSEIDAPCKRRNRPVSALRTGAACAWPVVTHRAITTKRKRPWGAGVFVVNLGVVGVF